MRKKSFFVLIISLSIFSSYSKETLKPGFRFIIDTGVAPIAYEKSVNGSANALFNSIFWGVRLNNFTIGGEVSDDYLSSVSNDLSYNAAFNILRFNINAFYTPIKYLEFKLGLGGGWLATNLKKQNSTKSGLNAADFSTLFDIFVRTPWPYFQLKFINRLDIFFNNTPPYYYGAFQYDFHPLFDWINLYMETGVRYWYYSDKDYNINDAIFVFKVGASFDMKFPLTHKRPEPKPINENIKKELQIAVADITFTTSSAEITQTSYPALDQIYKILYENPEIKIELEGHTNAIGDSTNELQLSQARISMVKKYLINKGISQNRINAIGYGGTRPKYDGVDPRNRRVEIRIIEDTGKTPVKKRRHKK